jgi:hypothetical protein
MKVYYSATDHHRISDESFKFHESPEHPDLKGKQLRSTAYIGPMDRVVMGAGVPTQADASKVAEVKAILDAAPVPTEGRMMPEVSEEAATNIIGEQPTTETKQAAAPKKTTKKPAKKPTSKKTTLKQEVS